MSPIQQLFQKALAAFQSGKFQEAERLFGKFIKKEPNHVAALNLMAVVLMTMERFDDAEPFIARAVKINQTSDVSYYNYGLILKRLKRPAQALQQFTKALQINSAVPEAWNNRGTVFNEIGQYENALADFDRALLINAEYTDAMCNKGKSLIGLKRFNEALAAYEKASILKPDSAGAWLGRGNASTELKRFDDALTAYAKALALGPDLSDAWYGRGNASAELMRFDDALDAYAKALSFDPNLAEAWLGRGNAFAELKRSDLAISAFERALFLKPDLAEASLGHGNVFAELKRFDEAFIAYERALALDPDLAKAWLARGNASLELKRFGEAFTAYERALSLDRHLPGVESARLQAKMHLCDWTHFPEESERLIASVRDENAAAIPFAFLGISSSPQDQLVCAKTWTNKFFPRLESHVWKGEIYKHDKIRVAYLSADFYTHATSWLIAEMFECHDKAQFDLTAISIGPDDKSDLRRRIENSFDKFVDASSFSDDAIAAQIREAEIDIVIDLKGFTQGARTNIFRYRPAPVQVSYLGYPGTMGAGFMDYLIADKTVIPAYQRAHYSEKIAYLPDSYQVNDSKRAAGFILDDRCSEGLPPKGFVFCCFNNNYKITPAVFDIWMRILQRVDGSVLWLIEDNLAAAANLRAEAVVRGVDAERLVFAKRVSMADHLARHSLADLFLDTLPYNAHTTASDALWAGLPVVTQMGGTFAGRVAASLLTAIGLPELITSSPQAYEDLAVGLARDAARLSAIKHKLATNRLTAPLFDARNFTRHIEAAYAQMVQRYRAGLPPQDIFVAR